MNKFYLFHSLRKNSKKSAFTALLLIFFIFAGYSQTTTLQPGSFIINMGVVPQTVGNGLKPYGMIYDLILNNKIPIQWIIESGKVKDGVDFTYNGIDYKGGPFIVPAEYRTAAVNARIAYWQTQGVIGVTTTSPITVPLAMTLNVSSVPRWTMDLLNGKVAVAYFTNAGIPATAYSLTKTPQELGYCDDIFVMPHAYPQWSTHSNLYFWNKTYHGSIWLSCTAGSELEDMFNPADHTQQTNFLTEKDPAVAFPTGSVTTIENALWLYSSHTNGVPPYTYADHGDQFMQFMGNIDSATQNGLEQVYIPKAPGWRASTTVGVYDPDHIKRLDDAVNHRAAIIAFGRGFGDPTRGYVMVEASHSLNNAQLPANIAAQRVFFNFSFMAGKNSTILPNVSGIPSSIVSGTATPVSFVFPVGFNPNDFGVTWYSSCGGTFTSDPAFPSDKTKAIYTPPTVNSDTSCPITVTITDVCGRVFNTSKASVITCNMQLVTTLKNACDGGSNGSITMNITGAGGPYNWSYGATTGTGTEISGLAAGNYTVTVVSGGGTGCSKTFTVAISSSPAISPLIATPTNVICNGLATGSINVANVTGGTPPFTFLWSDGATTQNRSGLVAGTYTVTATDASGCSVSESTTITQPAALAITPLVTNVTCNGNTTGAIGITTSGGTGTLSYLWSDGATTQNRTNLAAGIYSVTITDATNCSKTQSGISVTQPAALSLSATPTNVACNGGSTGAIDLTVSGGTFPYSYDWGGSIATEDRTGLTEGTYSVTVTDANGCSAVLSQTITQPTTLSISSAVTKASCPGISDGAIILSVSGGTANYSYSWSGPSSFTSNVASPTGLLAGTYNVTVTDVKGCVATSSVIVGNTKSSPVTPGTISK